MGDSAPSPAPGCCVSRSCPSLKSTTSCLQPATLRPITPVTHSCPVLAPLRAMVSMPHTPRGLPCTVPFMQPMFSECARTRRTFTLRSHPSLNPFIPKLPTHITARRMATSIIHKLSRGNATCWRMQTSGVDFIRRTAGALHRSIGPIAINVIPNAPSAWATAAQACFIIELCNKDLINA